MQGQSEIIEDLRTGCLPREDWPGCDDCIAYTVARQILGFKTRRKRKETVEKPKKKGKKAPAPTQETDKEPEGPSAQRESEWEEKIERVRKLEKDRNMMFERCYDLRDTVVGVPNLTDMTSEQLDRYIEYLSDNGTLA